MQAPTRSASTFALYGIGGLLGNIAATQVVGRLGTFRTSLLSTGAVSIGIAIWAAGAGLYLLMAAGLFVGARLCRGEFDAAGAACRGFARAGGLGRRVEYVGPLYRAGLGSAIGSALFVHAHYLPMGYLAVAVMIAALALIVRSRPAG